jgi:hypothetical protein
VPRIASHHLYAFSGWLYLLPIWRNKNFDAVVIHSEHSERFKGETTKKQYLRFVITLIGFASLGIIAKSQAVGQVAANIPFEFAVAGKTLPVGNYRVNRASHTDSRVLVLSSFENSVSALILPTEVASCFDDKANLTFKQIGGEHVLSKVEAADHVFTIPVSHAEILEAAGRSPRGTFASRSSAGN